MGREERVQSKGKKADARVCRSVVFIAVQGISVLGVGFLNLLSINKSGAFAALNYYVNT